MRLNKYIASATGMSRRAADEAVYRNRVLVNGRPPSSGQQVSHVDSVTLDGSAITPPAETITLLFHKPVGYVVSREGQGSRTIYELLPDEYQLLKPVGRLDKDSSGLLLLTTDGALAQKLTHPKYQKSKVYQIMLDKPLAPLHRQMIADHGIRLDDGVSKLEIERLQDGDDIGWQITMREGRNRQIRRTFESLGYTVRKLHRTVFGKYHLGTLQPGEISDISSA